ncbi:phosphatidylinositol phosphatase PTPRQ-like [Ornithodoros turicata]|uniref:phosphatidylinositol phosphatase PTPRQ-like n=1 Tax=Ornithodoros turicata TaxID=34597 RepID=UPI00313904F1
MRRISIWSALLLTVCVSLGSSAEVRLQKREADIYEKCLPPSLEDVKYEAAADKITLFPPEFSPEEECMRKGRYSYTFSYAEEGDEPRHQSLPGTEGLLVIYGLTPSTTYNITVAISYLYTSTNEAKETPVYLIKAKTRDLAVPPPPTTEIKLVDSSLLNKTQQKIQFPAHIFSDVNGAITRVDILVAQDTEIDKCEQPVTWKEAHSHSPIKCYNGGRDNPKSFGCLVNDETTVECVLGWQDECDDGMCNGPLTPGVKYGVKLRGTNKAGPTDSKPAFFTAGSPSGAAGTGRTTSGSSSLIGVVTFFVVFAVTK